MCYDSFQVIDQPRPCLFVINLAGSHANFRGVCFSVAYTTPNGKSCRSFPKSRSIYHNSRCTYPLKRPQSLSDAKNAKRQGNARVNIKNASESFLARCITMHESDARSVSTVPKGEQVKMTSFLPLDGMVLHGDNSLNVVYFLSEFQAAPNTTTGLANGNEPLYYRVR